MENLAPATVAAQGNSYAVTHGGDDNLMVEFYEREEQLGFESQKQGRPVYKTYTYVKINIPGERDERHRRMVPNDKFRFPRAWAAFEAETHVPVDGTPLEELAFINAGQRAELKRMHIHTAEALAGVADGNLETLGMGVRELQVKARAYLKNAEDSAHVTHLANELEKRDKTIERQAGDIQTMGDQMAKMQEAITRLTVAQENAGGPTPDAGNPEPEEETGKAKPPGKSTKGKGQ